MTMGLTQMYNLGGFNTDLLVKIGSRVTLYAKTMVAKATRLLRTGPQDLFKKCYLENGVN